MKTNNFLNIDVKNKQDIENLLLLGKVNVPTNYVSLMFESVKKSKLRPSIGMNKYRKSFFSTYPSLHVMLQLINVFQIFGSNEFLARLLVVISKGNLNIVLIGTLNFLGSNDKCTLGFSR
jgi:hypothetical protein